MSDTWKYRTLPSIMAPLVPMTEVVETDSDSSWLQFLALQNKDTTDFVATVPSSPLPLAGTAARAEPTLTVSEVMLEARRRNRIAPIGPQWQRLVVLLKKATDLEPPPALTPAELRMMPPLGQRARLRDQVEWAANHDQLSLVMVFLQSLREDDWSHIGA